MRTRSPARAADSAIPDPMKPAPMTPMSRTSAMRRRLLLRRLHLALTQLDPADLAREGLREVVDELDLARVGVRRQPVADVALDRLDDLVGRLVALGEDDERLDDVAAHLVGRGDRRRLLDRRMLEARRLHLERADPVAGGDDHVVGPPRVPDVAVLLLHRGVLRVEPVAAEDLLGVLRAVPVAERAVRVRPRPQADLAALALRDRPLVLVEDLDVPARHRPSHRALANLHEREVPGE